MHDTGWLMTSLSAAARATALRSSSPPDPSCNVSEVARLLWTMIVVATVVGVVCVLRPSWRLAFGLAGGALVWFWVDMEGPTLVSRGSHGLHLADLPVLIALLGAVVATFRLVHRRPGG